MNQKHNVTVAPRRTGMSVVNTSPNFTCNICKSTLKTSLDALNAKWPSCCDKSMELTIGEQ